MSSTAGRASRRAIAALTAVVLAMATAQALGADRRKVRWLTSVYIDAKGVGLLRPEGVTCGDDGFVVADTGNRRLLRFRYRDDRVEPEAVYPLPEFHPLRIHANSRGELYFLDGRERRIARVSPQGTPLGFVEPKGLPSRAQPVPKSFAIGPADEIFLLDLFSSRVLVLDANERYLRQVPFPEKYGFFSDVAVDPQGRIFLLDAVAGAVYAAAGGADRFARVADNLKDYTNFPNSLAIGPKGILYLVDQYGSGLALVDPDGEFLGRKLGLGWSKSGLYYPAQICLSRNGTLFIADRGNNRVQLFAVDEGRSAAPRNGN
jgi:sugar lactone lactonase YvrE